MGNHLYLLGIDIGTSGVKAVLFDQDGRSVSKNQQEYHFYNPKPGLSEIDPEKVWQKTVAVIKKSVIQSGLSPRHVVGMSLSVFCETTIPLDEKGDPLYPAMDSQDNRENNCLHTSTGSEINSVQFPFLNALTTPWPSSPRRCVCCGFMFTTRI